jgi:hypothetical protein
MRTVRPLRLALALSFAALAAPATSRSPSSATAAPAPACSRRRWRPWRSSTRFACASASSSPFFSAYSEKKLKNIIQGASGASDNTATRLEAFVVTGGTYAYGGYPDLDGLFQEQAAERDRKRREAILHRVQQLVQDAVGSFLTPNTTREIPREGT